MQLEHAFLLSQSPGDLIEERSLFLSTAAPGDSDRRIALAVVLVSVLVFIACVPFAKVPLAPLPAFIPIYQSALVLNDMITAVLLFGQFSILRSRALLLLASAYLFTACMTIAHTLTFPGLFSTTGLLGAGPQTTAWLYMFWHAGFPLLVLAYAQIRHQSSMPLDNMARFSVAICVAVVLAVACGLTLVATVGHGTLPAIMQGHRYTAVMLAVVSTVWGLSFLALIAMWRRRSRSMLDLWLMVAACAWSLDIALSAVLNAGRFDLGFYAGRIYGLLATSFVLVVLLLESSRLYALLIKTHRSERRKTAELRRLSTLDPLTGLANRRAFDQALDDEWRRATRHDTPLSLLMIDVDCFKRFNDRYGHVAGDQCLRMVGEVLAGNARRAGEVAARYGGRSSLCCCRMLRPLTRVTSRSGSARRCGTLIFRTRTRSRQITSPSVSGWRVCVDQLPTTGQLTATHTVMRAQAQRRSSSRRTKPFMQQKMTAATGFGGVRWRCDPHQSANRLSPRDDPLGDNPGTSFGSWKDHCLCGGARAVVARTSGCQWRWVGRREKVPEMPPRDPQLKIATHQRLC